jgi:hypothetical protein
MPVANILYDLFNYINNAFYICIFLNMMETLFPRKPRTNQLIYYGVPVAVFWLTYYYPQYAMGHSSIPYYYYFICLMSLSLIIIIVFLEGAVLEKIIYYLYYFTVYKCIVFFLGGLLYDYEPVMDKTIYMILDVLTTIVPVLALLVFRKFCLRYRLHTVVSYLNVYQLVLMLYCPLSLFASFQIADPSLNIPIAIYISISAFLLVFNVPIFYYLYSIIGESNENRIEMGKALAETAAQLSRYRYSVIMEEKAKKERHELKNKYFYIQTLLKENKLDQLENFLTEHIGELSGSDAGVYTNNSLIDYIINTKLAAAKRKNIKTYTEILIPEHININEEYFCTVLLNLFDNAIEASSKEPSPDIQIYLNIKNRYLVFRIKNMVSFDVLEENPRLFTSKEDTSSHGLGIKIIKRAVKKAGGILDLSMESGYFVATAMFPILSE